MNRLGLYGKIMTEEGKRDELVKILLQAAEELHSFDGCEMYVVNISEDEPNAIWVTEVWIDADAHKASLQLESVRTLIQQGRPLIAGMEQTKLRPLGGKGLHERG